MENDDVPEGDGILWPPSGVVSAATEKVGSARRRLCVMRRWRSIQWSMVARLAVRSGRYG